MIKTPFASSRRPKTLIFHIGDHKTGSTSIQLAFAQNRVSIEGHSLFYPAKLASNPLGDKCKAYAKATTPEERDKHGQPFQRLAARIRKSKADFVLVSAEALETVHAEMFHNIVQTFFADTADDIRIIGYVRPHAARLLSSYAERTKIGGRRVLASTVSSYIEFKGTDREFVYLQRFKAWRDAFGEKFLLRPMIRDQLYRKSVVDDFIHHAFGGLPFTVSGTDSANESLCLEDLMRLKVLQRHLKVSREMRLKIGWEMARQVGMLPPPGKPTKLRLHRALAEDIRDTYLEDARAMDKMFFDNAPMMENELHAAVTSAQDSPQSTEPADYLSESEMRSLDLMSSMVVGMFEAKEVDWPNFLHNKRVKDVDIAKKAPRK